MYLERLLLVYLSALTSMSAPWGQKPLICFLVSPVPKTVAGREQASISIVERVKSLSLSQLRASSRENDTNDAASALHRGGDAVSPVKSFAPGWRTFPQ